MHAHKDLDYAHLIIIEILDEIYARAEYRVVAVSPTQQGITWYWVRAVPVQLYEMKPE
jgi:hypothetical protein